MLDADVHHAVLHVEPKQRMSRLGAAVLALALASAAPGYARESPPARIGRETVESVERLLVETMTRNRIPGLSVAIVLDGTLTWSNGYGLADIENFVPATASTAYRTASIGKTMTAVAAMQLAEEGRLDIDVPVQRYCPAFPEKRSSVTAQHLLGHT